MHTTYNGNGPLGVYPLQLLPYSNALGWRSCSADVCLDGWSIRLCNTQRVYTSISALAEQPVHVLRCFIVSN